MGRPRSGSSASASRCMRGLQYGPQPNLVPTRRPLFLKHELALSLITNGSETSRLTLGILTHNTLQKAQSFCCELLGRVGEFAPDAAELGDTFHVGVKRTRS
jgi:hypothetical protein